MDDEKVLKLEDLPDGENLTQEDLDEIDKEMSEAVEETIKKIDEEVAKDKQLQQEADEMFDTDDIQERIKIWKKYHPNETMTF